MGTNYNSGLRAAQERQEHQMETQIQAFGVILLVVGRRGMGNKTETTI